MIDLGDDSVAPRRIERLDHPCGERSGRIGRSGRYKGPLQQLRRGPVRLGRWMRVSRARDAGVAGTAPLPGQVVRVERGPSGEEGLGDEAPNYRSSR